MERHEESLTGNGGVKISYDTWTPAPEPARPRGILVISHGLGEHGQRYDHVAERLGGLGLHVGGPDPPGPGPAGGPSPGLKRLPRCTHDLAPVRPTVHPPGLPALPPCHRMGRTLPPAH